MCSSSISMCCFAVPGIKTEKFNYKSFGISVILSENHEQLTRII